MLHALIGATLDVRARVSRGAELLDRRRPRWADEVDVERINMSHSWRCILGQVFGDFFNGKLTLEIPHNHAACRHGFISSLISMLITPLRRLEDASLRDAWVAAIRERTARERPRPRVRTLPCRCRTAEASFATAANGPPSYTLTE